VALTALLPLAAMAQNAANPPRLAADYGKLPLSFEANQGQTDSQVKFLLRGNGYSLFLTDKAAVLALTKADPLKTKDSLHGSPAKPVATKTDVVRMELAGASLATKVEGADPLPGTSNYFIGNDPSKWHTNVPTYSKVGYKNVYPGVDLLYYGNQRQLEYDFIVQPHANPNQVKLHFAGAAKLTLTAQGDLMVAAKNGEIAFHKPVIYQNATNQAGDSTSQREPVDGRFVLLASNSVGFTLGTYDRSRELVIDPILAYSTYLGGTGSDFANAIAVDASGSAYVTGYTFSAEFPTRAPIYRPTNTTKGEAFVTKLNPAGTGLVYSTYLGGTKDPCALGTYVFYAGDEGRAITVDSQGSAYVAGYACTSDFPVSSEGYQKANNGSPYGKANAFITKLNPAGSSLTYSTFLGGNGGQAGDFAIGIALDTSNHAYVVGQAWSASSFPVFPTATAFQKSSLSGDNGNNAFVAELTSDGSGLVYSTYLGGNFGDGAQAVAVDASGDAYVTGYSLSTNFPVTPANAYQKSWNNHLGSTEAFVTELNPTGTALVYSTYLGGSGCGVNDSGDIGFGIEVGVPNSVYVTGYTCSSDFPIQGAFQPKSNAATHNTTGFVSEFNTASGDLIYSTYLGGSGPDQPNSIAIDAKGDAYITGYTYSDTSSSTTGFPVTTNAYQQTNNASANKASNAFFTELNPAGSALVYSTYLGGSGNSSGNGDSGNGIALDTYGNPYIAGYSYSTNFPTLKTSFQPTTNAATGNSNSFIAHFEFTTPSTTTLTSDGNPAPLGAKVTFTADVTGTTGSGTPTGTVGFSIDKAGPMVIALDDTGHAAYSTTTLAAGVHSIVATYSGDPTHLASTSAAFSQTIYGPAATITAASGSGQSSTYGTAFAKPLVVLVKDSAGDVVPGATVTFSGTGLRFSATTVSTGANGEASVTGTPIAVGTLTASASVTGAKTPATFTLTVTKATLIVTATNQTIAYNAAIPSPLPYTIAGYVNGDTSKAVTGAPVLTTTATKGSQPGTYPITVALGTLAATDYTFKLVNGTLTITALGVTATPAATQTITIADATAGYAVYYTTNGTTPTTSSTKYTGPITITATETLKFIAVAPGYTPSAVRTVADTIQ
jgi:hypothetical protein